MSGRTELRRMAAQGFPDQERLHRMVPEAERARGLQRILGGRRLHPVPDPAPGGRRWGPALVGVAVAAVLTAVAAFVLPGAVGERTLPEVAAPAPAATPVLDPAGVLAQLADRAAAQPPVPAKPFDYVRSKTWGPTTIFADGVETDRGGDPVVAGKEALDESEIWSNADAVGRIRSSRAGARTDQDVFDTITDGTAEVGHRIGPVPDLPADPAALEAALLALQPGSSDRPTVYDVMAEIWSQQPVEPQVQAAFLRLLAMKDGVQVLGPVTDRIGRNGLAVTLTDEGGGPTGSATGGTVPHRFDYRFVVDPDSGALLEYERADFDRGRWTSRSGTVWLVSGRVDSITEYP